MNRKLFFAECLLAQDADGDQGFKITRCGLATDDSVCDEGGDAAVRLFED